MRTYLLAFAKEHDLFVREDAAGNICIVRQPAPACKNAQKVVLESHMDIVCEKDLTRAINFATDPIETEITGDWIGAKGTTLGADNGIGIAYCLAALTENIHAGRIECLFTVHEETGLTGAKAVSREMFTGSQLINLDSEEEERQWQSFRGYLRPHRLSICTSGSLSADFLADTQGWKFISDGQTR